MSMLHHTKTIRFLGIASITAIVFALGVYTGNTIKLNRFVAANQTLSTGTTTADGKDLEEFWHVWDIMHEKYPFADKEPDDKNKIYGAIAGLVDSYQDPYTIFFPPKEAKLFNEQVKGSFGGVGMEVGIKNNLVTVIAPLKDSPAEKAGILAGDIIAEVDGKKTDGLDIDTVISLIRGERGSRVELTIARSGETELLPFSIVRDTISLPIIDTETRGDVFIINLYSFSENSAVLFRNALDAFVASGNKKLILDLRNNPGGYLDSAIEIASFFLPKDTVIVRENSGDSKSEEVHLSRGYTLLPKDIRVVVLMNGGSASASEILAGALAENKVATTVGTQSFGKGSVQQLINLPDRSSLKITVAKWLTPKGVSISDKGITPSILVDEQPTQDPTTKKWSDPQLDKAIQLLQ